MPKNAPREILIKPQTEGQHFVQFDSIRKNINSLSKFDVIGVTEKEIGNSVLERMQQIATIRLALNRAGIGSPIHVFGSLDTTTTLFYFVAGADIFDGLTWLRYWKSDRLVELVRKDAVDSAAEYEALLAGYFGELLSGFNDRDVNVVNHRLDEIKTALQEELETTFDHIFGGSVAKHTYVDGLSDIDSLLVINESRLVRETPEKVLSQLVKILRSHLGQEATVDRGRLAVTVAYADGMVIQLLPAIRAKAGLRIRSGRSKHWSNIDPEQFRSALIKRNGDCGGRNGRKIDAIAETAIYINAIGFESYRLEILEDLISALRRLAYIGRVTAYHLAKNLGADVAKPDRHLVRLAASQGFYDVHSLCSTIAKETGDPLRVVDIVLWRFLVQTRQFGSCTTSE